MINGAGSKVFAYYAGCSLWKGGSSLGSFVFPGSWRSSSLIPGNDGDDERSCSLVAVDVHIRSGGYDHHRRIWDIMVIIPYEGDVISCKSVITPEGALAFPGFSGWLRPFQRQRNPINVHENGGPSTPISHPGATYNGAPGSHNHITTLSKHRAEEKGRIRLAS